MSRNPCGRGEASHFRFARTLMPSGRGLGGSSGASKGGSKEVLCRCLVAIWFFLLAAATTAQSNAPAPTLLLTNFGQMWGLGGEAAQHPQHIRLEAVIAYYDLDWSVCFGECDGNPTYLPLYGSKLALKSG